ncbi:MAG: hypothetical protein ABIR59_02915 [Gemmatimonadales bacterium]
MTSLRIQHTVSNFDGWKRAFESDPMDRKGSGVVRYHVHRAIADPTFVMIDLEFTTTAQAETMLERLRQLWAGPGRAVVRDPHAWVLETLESQSL